MSQLSVSTHAGLIMGTVGYMSPEQARGLNLDARTDLFSLGVVLYEMVAGHAPFTGATPSDVIAAILTYDPPLLDTVPAALQGILKRALHKEREQRYQSSAEFLVDLKTLRQNGEAPPIMAVSRAEQTPNESPAAAPSTSRTTTLRTSRRRNPGAVLAAVIALAVLLLGGLGLWQRFKPAAGNAPASFQTMRLQRITTNGKIAHEQAVISPDGKYLVYVVEEGGQQSLWLKHLVTQATARIAPAVEITYAGLAVSHDSNYLYYITHDANAGMTLYQVALVGGTPRKLLTEVTSSIALAPDDRQMAFVRKNPATGETALMVANTDGTGVRKLTARLFPDEIFWPSWHPQQERIAFVALKNDPQGRYMELRAVTLADGTEHRLSQHTWGYAGQIGWLPDGSGLLLTAADLPINPAQIWHVSLAQDTVRKITNDLNNYNGLSLTARAESLVSIQTEKNSKLWLFPSAEERLARQIVFGGGKYEGVMGLTWTPDNRIIYSSSTISNPELESGEPDLWIMQADGSGQTQLTFHARTNIRPVMTRDGRYIVWASNRVERPNIWRMNADGSNPVRLTKGVDDVAPDCSPDGRWVVYQGIKETRPVLWKVSIDGGEATALTSEVAGRPVFSPDGRWIACYYYDPHAAPPRWRLAILPSEGGPPTRLFDLPATVDRLIAPRWTADGQALLYVNTRAGVSNLWRQALATRAPQPLSNFKSDLIFNFAYSREGKQLVCARGTINHDVVMMTDFR